MWQGPKVELCSSVGRYVELLKTIDSVQMQQLHLSTNDNCVEHGSSGSIEENLVRAVMICSLLVSTGLCLPSCVGHFLT